ncbi:DUF1853 family protein [Halopseudomonas xinjiangensis]|uniref:DUF1853 family protein n=1 Tax=Halopseudomonas xinjiangensis TaxID=487184 RepID=UPI001E5A62FE|nr:DUF1853 family protein [Halopseudomonas xinjiangensis]
MSVLDPLAGSVWRSDPEQRLYALRQLDNDPVRLAQLIGPSKDYRLGSYYERLWRAMLTIAPDIEVLAHNVAIRQAQRSVGELDLVIETADGAVTHLELAIKFYLGRADIGGSAGRSSQHAWWGPDPRDRLAIKINRLINHQLPMATRYSELLAGLPRIDRSCAWLQGCLFYPADSTMPAAEQAYVPPCRHTWRYRGELNDSSFEGWFALPHKKWLAPTADNFESVLDWDGTLSRGPVMLVRKASRDSCDVARMLIMPDGWPDLATPPKTVSADDSDRV